MTSLIEQQFLTEIRTYDGEKYFAKISVEDFQKIYNENEIISLSYHDNKRIKKANIKSFWPASDVDFIKIFVIPKLPWDIKNRLTDMLNRAELNGFSPSKNAILAKISELQKEYQNS